MRLRLSILLLILPNLVVSELISSIHKCCPDGQVRNQSYQSGLL